MDWKVAQKEKHNRYEIGIEDREYALFNFFVPWYS